MAIEVLTTLTKDLPETLKEKAPPVSYAAEADKQKEQSSSEAASDYNDVFELSGYARKRIERVKESQETEVGKKEQSNSSNTKLSEDEQKEISELKSRDQEVKIHEQAHIAAGGPYITGGPEYSYQKGPDGNKYAVGGHVSIDTSPVEGDPKATITKMEAVKRAALAPANPSGADQAVAAKAAKAAAQARTESLKNNEASDNTPNTNTKPKETPLKRLDIKA